MLALFLLPHNLNKLTPKFLALKPGIADRRQHVRARRLGRRRDRDDRRRVRQLVHVAALDRARPASRARWKLPNGELTLKQEFQMVSGTLANGDANTAVSGKLRGDLITFTAGTEYTGRDTATR